MARKGESNGKQIAKSLARQHGRVLVVPGVRADGGDGVMKCGICKQDHDTSYAINTVCVKALLARIEELEAQLGGVMDDYRKLIEATLTLIDEAERVQWIHWDGTGKPKYPHLKNAINSATVAVHNAEDDIRHLTTQAADTSIYVQCEYCLKMVDPSKHSHGQPRR